MVINEYMERIVECAANSFKGTLIYEGGHLFFHSCTTYNGEEVIHPFYAIREVSKQKKRNWFDIFPQYKSRIVFAVNGGFDHNKTHDLLVGVDLKKINCDIFDSLIAETAERIMREFVLKVNRQVNIIKHWD